MRPYLTFKHCELGTGVDLSNVVGGRALVNSFIPVRAQRLDTQHGAWAVVKLDHLKSRGKKEETGQQIYYYQGWWCWWWWWGRHLLYFPFQKISSNTSQRADLFRRASYAFLPFSAAPTQESKLASLRLKNRTCQRCNRSRVFLLKMFNGQHKPKFPCKKKKKNREWQSTVMLRANTFN